MGLAHYAASQITSAVIMPPAQPVLAGTPSPATVELPAGTTSYTFFTRRARRMLATTQAFTVRLGSGRSVPKFVGGGPSAF
jgi:hypothetical protein